MIGVAWQLEGHKYTRSEQRGEQMEKEDANADEIRDSVNSTDSLSFTDRLEQVGAPQVIEQVRFKFKNVSLLGGRLTSHWKQVLCWDHRQISTVQRSVVKQDSSQQSRGHQECDG
jgi:hypothetical protein